jgi:hypothetical protein
VIEYEGRTPTEIWMDCAFLMRQREEELGSAWSDGPSSQQMFKAIDIISDMTSRDQTPKELHDANEYVAKLADSWRYPEIDLACDIAQPVLDELIVRLGRQLDAAVPGAAESRQRWTDLRAAARLLNRRVAEEEQRKQYLRSLPLGKRIKAYLFGIPYRLPHHVCCPAAAVSIRTLSTQSADKKKPRGHNRRVKSSAFSDRRLP